MNKGIFLLACLVLGGCAASASYNTKVLDSAPINPQKILVIETSGKKNNSSMDVFQDALIDELRACSIKADYVHLDLQEPDLSLNNYEEENRQHVAKAVGRLGPDYLLTLREPYPMGPWPNMFKLELINAAAKHTVWNGNVKIQSVGMLSGPTKIGTMFAKSLVQQLSKAGFLKSCPVSEE